MIKLLQNFSITQIVLFIVLLSLAIKGCISFFDFITERTKKAVHKADQPIYFKEEMKKQSKQIDQLKVLMAELTKKVQMLINSDKDSIKAYITKQHHHFVYDQKWIDDYSLDCIEQRYAHYKDQGGNSFIAGLMKELRELPLSDLSEQKK